MGSEAWRGLVPVEERRDLPADDDPVVVPARPVTVQGRRVPAVEVRQLRVGGERVGLAFTSPQRLVAALGPWQPWVGLPMGAYVRWLRSGGVTRVHVDPEYGEDVRTWTPAVLADTVRGVEGAVTGGVA